MIQKDYIKIDTVKDKDNNDEYTIITEDNCTITLNYYELKELYDLISIIIK